MNFRMSPFRKVVRLSILSVLFNLDYALTESFSRIIGLIGVVAFPAFHFYEKALGYRDCNPMRIACALFCLALSLWPVRPRWRMLRSAYWEILLFFMLPLSQTVLFLVNRNDAYWVGSNVFWAFFPMAGLRSRRAWTCVCAYRSSIGRCTPPGNPRSETASASPRAR